MFTAQKGCGAFLNGSRITVNDTQTLPKSTIAFEVNFGRAPFLRPTLLARLTAFLERSMTVRSFGSAALEMGYVAKGSFDSFIAEHLKPWDIAAGALIVVEAGGVVIDVKGGVYKIMQPNVIAASSMEIAMGVKDLLDGVGRRMEDEGTSVRALYGKFRAAGGSIQKL
jgi:myo-inositol-1(or 4)-monophosphatase